ncbi:ABC transporter ATP-binding protein [Inconstantimicrobium mannanitabidum]|uniref:Lipid A export permease/ATP-binding protein MsbA n=1 Tax=Inconstantimicrobium mannanitabidum TaxID=1604901 RepID=A0ACB5RDL7_9CLOT|nr:ABC transporter ATP-binding protein [Clostridium sp. TW13]GKX67365.1 lipid A export permease/ATP-binding protein MsbA [Clostridium sp. TW13]
MREITGSKVFSTIISFIKPYWYMVALCLLGTIFGTAVDVIQAKLLQYVVDSAIAGKQEFFIKIVFLLVLIMLFSSLIKYVIKYFSGHLGISVIRDVRSRIAYCLQKLPARYIELHHSGDIISRINNDVGAIQGFVEGNLTNLVYYPLIILGISLYLIYLNWKLLVVSLIILPISMIASNKLGNAIGKYSVQLQQEFAKFNSIIQDVTGGIFIVKSYNIENLMFDKLKTITENILDKKIKTDRRCMAIAPISMILGVIPNMSCILYGGYLTILGEITPGELLTFTYLLGFLIGPIAGIPNMIVAIKITLQSSKRIIEILEEPEERQDGTEFDEKDCEKVVEFASVSYAYDKGKYALNKLNLCLKKGKVTALVGSSGSGKSTVCKLLCGFYEHYEGEIKIYGESMKYWSLKGIRKQISFMSQDTILFPCSIYENISFGRIGATKEEVIEAAKAANAHEFISKLSNGYETIIGERGATLSGGQRQRIAIARAILKDSPIVLLDEPTSALDVKSERMVKVGLERFLKDRTVLIIAHRLSTVENADEIIVMNEGNVVGYGTHKELIEKNDLYRRLYYKQFSLPQEGEDACV